MGWLRISSRPIKLGSFHEDLKSTTQHIETISLSPETPKSYPFVPLSTRDSELPFVPPEEVSKHKSAEVAGFYIVIDDIVYDCTQFISEHPGGAQTIQPFAGAECGWQFWRFHGEREMEEFGRVLRVGRTKRIENKFKEPPRYVGLRRFGEDGWE